MPLERQNKGLTFSIAKCNVGLKTFLHDGLIEYFSNLLYKFRMSDSNSGILELFENIVTHYTKILNGYTMNVLRKSAHIVINPNYGLLLCFPLF